MAALPSLFVLVSALVSVAHAGYVVASEAADKPNLVRREVGLDSQGHVQSLVKHQEASFDLTECDRQFVVGDEGADECKGTGYSGIHGKVESLADCHDAAVRLEIAEAATSAFVLNTATVAVNYHPTGCFVDTSVDPPVIAFNGQDISVTSNATETLVGKKICLRSKYINGTADTGEEGCTGDADGIFNMTQCQKAAMCEGGAGVCLMRKFEEHDPLNPYKSATQPRGCFKNTADDGEKGCFGFNHMAMDESAGETIPKGAMTASLSVCANKAT